MDDVATKPGAAPAIDGFTPPDRYVLIERLGHGGMGTVWAAHDKVLDRTIALKVLHDEFLGAEDQARLVAEARAMARLSHRNVVDVYDVAEKDGRTYLTMELVRGISLDKWLETPREWRAIAGVFRAAALGLAAAHGAGIIHRDVKPANILVGDDGEVRVADFGVAHASVAKPDPDVVPTAVTRGMIGTLAYMAPEQLRGEAANARSDQFAFFSSLYEALHGKRPFLGEDVADQIAIIERGCPAPIHDVPRWLHAIIERGLSADPAQRFADMDAVATQLEGPHRREWMIGGGLIALAALSLIAIVSFRPHHDAPVVEGPAPCRSSIELVGDFAGQGQAARKAFAALGAPYALDTWKWVAEGLSDREIEWANRNAMKCHEPDPVRTCIEEVRLLQNALWRRLLRVDRAGLARLSSAFVDLPAVDECTPSALGDLASARADLALGATADGLAAAARAASNADAPTALAGSLVHARLALALGRTDEGIAELAQVASRATGTVQLDARLALVAAQLDRAHLDDAKAELARITGEAADARRRSQQHLLAARLAHAREDSAIEIAELEFAVRDTIGDHDMLLRWAAPIHEALARAYLGAGRGEEALVVTKRLVDSVRPLGDTAPAYGHALALSARVNLALNRIDKARAKLVNAQRAIDTEENLDTAEVHDVLAGIAIAEKNHELAVTELRAALAIREKLAPAAEETFATKKQLAQLEHRR